MSEPFCAESNDDPAQSGPSARIAIRRDPTVASGLRPRAELAERTPVGDVYLRSLIRAQLLLSLRVTLVLVLVLVGPALVFAIAPDSRRVKLLGVPIAWPLLGFALYPAMMLIAALFVRRADRTEAEFVELVEPRDRSR
jgi:hypothetical protein